MISHDRRALRQQLAQAWSRFRDGRPVDALQAQIGQIVQRHPEYQALVEDPDAVEQSFAPEDGNINPFLHLSLHIAIDDQLRTDRPPGIRTVHAGLAQALGDTHAADHVLVERLGEALWQASRDQRPPQMDTYLAALNADLERLRRGPGRR